MTDKKRPAIRLSADDRSQISAYIGRKPREWHNLSRTEIAAKIKKELKITCSLRSVRGVYKGVNRTLKLAGEPEIKIRQAGQAGRWNPTAAATSNSRAITGLARCLDHVFQFMQQELNAEVPDYLIAFAHAVTRRQALPINLYNENGKPKSHEELQAQWERLNNSQTQSKTNPTTDPETDVQLGG